MKAGMKGMTKMEKLMDSDCRLKDYMLSKSLWEVRETFRMRTQLLEGFKSNMKNLHRGRDLSRWTPRLTC